MPDRNRCHLNASEAILKNVYVFDSALDLLGFGYFRFFFLYLIVWLPPSSLTRASRSKMQKENASGSTRDFSFEVAQNSPIFFWEGGYLATLARLCRRVLGKFAYAFFKYLLGYRHW